MPSFAIHCICGNELLKKLKVSEDDKKSFMIGNIIPDVSRIKSYKNLDDKDKRIAIQQRKKETHFRLKTGSVLEYPNCQLFLDKYEDLIKNDIVVLAYFFHLYCDYYYFKYFFKNFVVFLDNDMKETDKRSECKYVKIIKNDKVVASSLFFNKSNDKGIYKEYTRCDSIMIEYYKLYIDVNDLVEFIDEVGFNINIEETNSLFAYYAIHKIDKYINNSNKKICDLLVFDKDKVIDLPNDIIKSFIKEYGYLLDKFI